MAEDSEVPPDCITSKEELLKHLRELDRPITVEELEDILGSTVKHDDDNKTITFLAMLLNYTEEDQINLGFLAESSTGKSYIPIELSWYFPKEDLMKLGYVSPTAFFHEYGILITDPHDKRDIEEEKKRKLIVVDLHKKIIVFLDQPHSQLLERLRSLLSHDEKKITQKITDRRERSGLRTKTVIIEGYPTILFCSAKFSMQDQEKTRLLLLSPEINQEKLREAVCLKIEKESNREAFQKRMEEDPNRKFLANRVASIRTAHIKYINISEELRSRISEEFLELHKALIPRHQRDISRLLAIIKAHALLNFRHREETEDTIMVNETDVQEGFRLYNSVREANELGLSPELFNIFEKLKPHIVVKGNGISINEFQECYPKEFHKRLGYENARRILKTLCSVGLLTESLDPGDRRIKNYTLLRVCVTENDEPSGSTKLYPLYTHPVKSIVSIPEVYENLKTQFKEPFLEQKALERIMKLRGCDQAEAEKLFQILVDESKVFRDEEGLWRF